MNYRYRITTITNEVYWKHRRSGSRLRRVPGTKKIQVRVDLVASTRDGLVHVTVLRRTQAAAASACCEVLGFSDDRWAGMLEVYGNKKRAEEERLQVLREKFEKRCLKNLVLAGEKASRELKGSW